jgi:hypothetical protein
MDPKLSENEVSVMVNAVGMIQSGYLAAEPKALEVFKDVSPQLLFRLHEGSILGTYIFYGLITRTVSGIADGGPAFPQFCDQVSTLFEPPIPKNFLESIFSDPKTSLGPSDFGKWSADRDNAWMLFEIFMRILAAVSFIYSATFGGENVTERSHEILRDVLGKMTADFQ